MLFGRHAPLFVLPTPVTPFVALALCARPLPPMLSHEKAPPAVFHAPEYTLVCQVFMGSMMAQYILTFFAVPFSEVDNRPSVTVLLCLFSYLLVCVFLRHVCSSALLYRWSALALVCSSIGQRSSVPLLILSARLF